MDDEINLDPESPAAVAAARQAREVVAARVAWSGDPVDRIFVDAVGHVLSEVAGDDERTSCLIAALARLAASAVTLAAAADGQSKEQMMGKLALLAERDGWTL